MRTLRRARALALLTLLPAPAMAASYALKSPDNAITLTVRHDPKNGTLSYDVSSRLGRGPGGA